MVIRRMREDDLEPLHRLLSDPRVMRHLEPPYTKGKTRQFLHCAGLSDPPRIYAAEKDNAFIGYVIEHDYDEAGIEIGWVLLPEHWGKGYASALTEQLVERALSLGKEAVIESAPGQEASRHIARKFGFEYQGVFDGLDVFRLRDKPPFVKERRI